MHPLFLLVQLLSRYLLNYGGGNIVKFVEFRQDNRDERRENVID